jgi:hypothetical protein
MKQLIEGRVLQYCDILIEALAEPYFSCPASHCNDVKWGVCVENDCTCKHFNGIATKVSDPWDKCYEKAYIRCGLKAEIETKIASRKAKAEVIKAKTNAKAAEVFKAFMNR